MRELESLPEKLEILEQEVEQLQEQVNTPDFFTQSVEITQPVLNALEEKEKKLELAFERWEELEAMQQEIKN